MSGFIEIATTFAKKDEAELLAKQLLEKRLAGCVQIHGPITSIYRWQDRIEQAEEFLCLIKSHEEHYAEIERAIKATHPYQVPQILALPIKFGSAEYLHWLRQELKEI